MSIIPAEILSAWEMRAHAGNMLILQNLIDFKPFDEELQHGEKLQAYAEAAKANRMSQSTFREKFYLVKRFQDADLLRLFAMGISFDHLDKAPSLAEACNRSPLDLLEAAVEVGGKTGETMTVEEMITFALGETDKPKAAMSYHVDRMTMVILRKFRNLFHWDEDKSKRFESRLRELFQEFAGG